MSARCPTTAPDDGATAALAVACALTVRGAGMDLTRLRERPRTPDARAAHSHATIGRGASRQPVRLRQGGLAVLGDESERAPLDRIASCQAVDVKPVPGLR